MDNAKAHHKEGLYETFKGFQTIKYLPPYSPPLNPIEFVFNKAKKKVYQAQYNDDYELIDVMINVCIRLGK